MAQTEQDTPFALAISVAEYSRGHVQRVLGLVPYRIHSEFATLLGGALCSVPRALCKRRLLEGVAGSFMG